MFAVTFFVVDISALILRKKPTVLQSISDHTLLFFLYMLDVAALRPSGLRLQTRRVHSAFSGLRLQTNRVYISFCCCSVIPNIFTKLFYKR